MQLKHKYSSAATGTVSHYHQRQKDLQKLTQTLRARLVASEEIEVVRDGEDEKVHARETYDIRHTTPRRWKPFVISIHRAFCNTSEMRTRIKSSGLWWLHSAVADANISALSLSLSSRSRGATSHIFFSTFIYISRCLSCSRQTKSSPAASALYLCSGRVIRMRMANLGFGAKGIRTMHHPFGPLMPALETANVLSWVAGKSQEPAPCSGFANLPNGYDMLRHYDDGPLN